MRDMATVKYNAKKLTFSVIWKDYGKEAHGSNYPYIRKSCKWRGPHPPSCRERRRMLATLAGLAAEQEARSAAHAHAATAGVVTPFPAVDYLLQLRDEELATTHSPAVLQRARKVVRDFTGYLCRHHPDLLLHEVSTSTVLGYYEHLRTRPLAYGTKKCICNRLSFIFRRIALKYEAGPLKYTNPFERLKLTDIVCKTEPSRKKILTIHQLRLLLRESLSGRRLSNSERLQRFSIIYLLIVTGWRLGDVVTLKWEQIDTAQRSISLLHAKTTAKGIRTTIYITDFMARLLQHLQTHAAASSRAEYVFGHRSASARNFKAAAERSVQTFFERMRHKYGLTESTCTGQLNMHAYSVHSLRGSAITHLTEADFSEVKINYLVGHAPRTIEQRHYLRLDCNPEQSTRALIEHMETLIEAVTYYPILETLTL